MTKAEEIRAFLDKAITERGMNYRQVSLAIGRGHQYIQQYIKSGFPLYLKEEDRKAIAKILNINEQELSPNMLDSPFVPTHIEGVSALASKITSVFKKDEVTIEMIDATACCGDGIDNLPEKTCGHWRLPIAEFKSITSSNPENLRMLRVQGDSMKPTIDDGDWVWVDTSNNYIGSDGIYLVKLATGLAVKRLQSGLSNVVIKSDNPTYSDITADVGEVKIIGKVVYILNGRRV
jgi:hypothetical protein